MKHSIIDLAKAVPEGFDDRVHVITHNFPDPDSIASAVAMRHIIHLSGLKPGDIYYTGAVSHPQNRTMVTRLSIDLINYSEDRSVKTRKT